MAGNQLHDLRNVGYEAQRAFGLQAIESLKNGVW
jgi:hypothetical protein